MDPLPPKRHHRKQKQDGGTSGRRINSEAMAVPYPESLVTGSGPDADAVSFTSDTSTVSSNTSEGSALVRSLIRDGPKAAWSDDIEMKSLIHNPRQNDRENSRKIESIAFPDRSGFDNSAFIKEPGNEKLLNDLDSRISVMSGVLENWKTARASVERNARQARHDVERRKKCVKEAILKYVQSLNDEITEKSKENLKEIDTHVNELESMIERMRKLKTNCGNMKNREYLNVIKECIKDYQGEISRIDVDVPDYSDRMVYHSAAKQSDDLLHVKIHKLLGEIGSYPSASLSKYSDVDSDEDTAKDSDIQTDSEKDDLLENPEVLLTFSCRLKKDKRTCGITDIAVTDQGDIFVVDKHNKTIKMYDKNGLFERYVGTGILRKPSRVTFLPAQRLIIASDDFSRIVHSFKPDGTHIQALITTINFPIDHCQTVDNKIAVIEFGTKSITICSADGYTERTFTTGLDCPAYICCTPSGRLIVSDWKAGCVRMFNQNGDIVRNWTSNSAGERIQPYGVCADGQGHVLVADRNGRAVVCLAEDGEALREYDEDRHKIGFPFAITCTRGSVRSETKLIVAEYSGGVKILNYLDPSDSSRLSNASNC